MQKTQAVIDSDFLQGILKNGSRELFIRIMDEAGISPVVHQYVAEIELQYCEEAQKLIDEGYIEKIEYDSFLSSDADKKLYNMQVWEILEEISKKELPPERYRNVFRKGFRLTEYSIGEVMSELMAKKMRLPLFASNDFGAKRIANSHFNSARYKLDVKNIAELLNCVVDNGTDIPWKQMKTLLREERWSEDKELLREKYMRKKDELK